MRIYDIINERTERLFHGSPSEFDEFDPSRVGDRMVSLGLAHYLTPNRSTAMQYTGDNGYVMEFDVTTDDFLDWDNLTTADREKITQALLKHVPSERISHFGKQRVEAVPRNNAGIARYNELRKLTKDAYNDYAKARILGADEIARIIPDFDFKNDDDVVIGWREPGSLDSANNVQLMTLMNEYYPELARALGYKGARYSDQVAVYDTKLAKRVK